MTLLRQADLFAFPSPAEGFPKVVLDAMAAGLPVVARPVGGLRELIAADLLEPADDDAAMLAALIMRLAADPARAEHLRGAASDFAARHTRPAEAARVAETWRKEFVHLPWTE
jgi:glycosyltransferase involved in cell wall biosynthesis